MLIQISENVIVNISEIRSARRQGNKTGISLEFQRNDSSYFIPDPEGKIWNSLEKACDYED